MGESEANLMKLKVYHYQDSSGRRSYTKVFDMASGKEISGITNIQFTDNINVGPRLVIEINDFEAEIECDKPIYVKAETN